MKRFLPLFPLLLILGLLIAGCGGAAVEPTETPLPDSNNPMAALQTLTASTTLVPPTPVGGVEVQGPDDYVGIVKQAWALVNAEYVRDNFNGADWPAVYDEYVARAESVSSSEELWVLLGEMIRELNDDHSRHVPPDRMTAEFGIETSAAAAARPASGIVIWPGPSREDEYIYVWEVCQDSAAASAGISRGDIILAVDGNPIEKVGEEFTRDDYYPVIFGTGNDQVTLTVWQGPDLDPVDLTLPLGGVGECPYREHFLVSTDPRIGYIRLPDFDGDTEAYLLSALSDLEQEAPLDGVIVDVRHNPGGNSDASMEVFAEGIIGTEGPFRADSQRTIYRLRGPVGWNDTTPLAVITDGSSHSAADYFPAGLQELDRAVIVGMNSAGNTEGITGFTLADGTLIRLAITTLALNDGTVIEGVGVTPDVIVPLGTWGLKAQPYDTQIQAAIDTLLEMIGE